MSRPWVKQFIVDRVGNILGPDDDLDEKNTRVFYAVVVDRKEFDSLMDVLVGKRNFMNSSVDVSDLTSAKKDGAFHLMKRDHMTEFVFQRYGVLGDLVTVAVRGQGEEVLEGMLD